MTTVGNRIYTNPEARSWKFDAELDPRIKDFHYKLPEFSTTPLISLSSIAQELGIKNVFVKDESRRAGLPAFKILGASWATYRAMVDATNSAMGLPLIELSAAARKQGIKLFAATDGNHGRAVARMAKISGLGCDIFVPSNLDQSTQNLIASEGARVIVEDGDYDYTVQQARAKSNVSSGLFIQDTALEGYTEIAQWIVDGYSTMMVEAEQQVFEATGNTVDLAVIPVGVGSFAQSAVSYWKSRSYQCTTVTVEPNTAACLQASLINGVSTPIPTQDTIMSGLNCGTVSTIAWPILKSGVDASVTVDDLEADTAVRKLHSLGVSAGPCGAATLAALQLVAKENLETVWPLKSESTVILFCTEGSRVYQQP